MLLHTRRVLSKQFSVHYPPVIITEDGIYASSNSNSTANTAQEGEGPA